MRPEYATASIAEIEDPTHVPLVVLDLQRMLLVRVPVPCCYFAEVSEEMLPHPSVKKLWTVKVFAIPFAGPVRMEA